ncbi:phosphoenolpyruvate--protein phosphotransferase [Mycoplasma sp. SG1]|uniref:phosphoenolpyruvate--protein phosphotransferase n=1 Tax=Mycoplasma sp. SG1 TaxID=2810348 RepID=UPI002023E013|nr:phosphoenolpyruvate--protein phosphotransferase [Mycoplasma sp. SG1]URM53010.1 phosphoenolpyruvate--protein phosphotransferase [Mycoplasma sp. SG1]
MKNNIEFKGIVINSGYALGKAKVIIKETIISSKVVKKMIKDNEIAPEISKLNKAIEYLIKENQETQLKLKDKLSKEDSEIFQSFLTILQDRIMIEEIEALIKNEKVAADYAVNDVLDKYVKIFQDSPDQYFIERAEDLISIKNNLISRINNQVKENCFDVLESYREDFILITNELEPVDISTIFSPFLKGIILYKGAASSHIAILLKNFKIPVLFSVHGLKNQKDIHDQTIVIDAKKGYVHLNLEKEELAFFAEKQKVWETYQKTLESYGFKKTVTLDGFECLVEANIGNVEDAEKARQEGADGVGLFRTEFFFTSATNWPNYLKQATVYAQIAAKFKDFDVVYRTLDIGADKVLPYYEFEKEDNPFLGKRGIRFSLAHKSVFRDQLKALLRTSAQHKNVNIMLPMVSTIKEIEDVKLLIQELKKELHEQEHLNSFDYKLGIMVETPAVAVAANLFAPHVDFFSIGTNDLIQYSMAADRTNSNLSHLYQPLHPGILKLIHNVIWAMNNLIAKTNSKKKWVGMCGDAAGYALAVPLFIGMGLQNYSVSISSVNYIRYLISNLIKKDCDKLLETVLNEVDHLKIAEIVEQFFKDKKLIQF